MSLLREQRMGLRFVTRHVSQDRIVRHTADWFAKRLQGYDRPVQIRFCDGMMMESENGRRPRLPEASASMFRPPLERALGESYILGDVDVVGDFEDVFPLVKYPLDQRWTASDRLRFIWHQLIGPHSRAERLPAERKGARHGPAPDFSAVRFHYDLPTEFYQLWLDSRMVYACAYFTRGDDELDEAQAGKLDYLCRKLRLQPEDRVLDIGCG